MFAHESVTSDYFSPIPLVRSAMLLIERIPFLLAWRGTWSRVKPFWAWPGGSVSCLGPKLCGCEAETLLPVQANFGPERAGPTGAVTALLARRFPCARGAG